MRVALIYLLFFTHIILGNNNIKTLPKDSLSKDSLVNYSMSFLGTKYCYGSCNPQKGFDCSGFVYHIFSHFNIKVPRSSKDYISCGITIHPDSFKIGDIIIFTGTSSKSRKPGHVGIITSNYNNELQFLHSSSNKKHSGIKLSNFTDAPYYKNRFIKIVRIASVY
ncbi:MAG: NlpC/P60 family protein [Bacteroidia bacterium]